MPQFLGGVRGELEAVQHPQRAERRTRETVRVGAWARPAVVRWAVRRGERLAAVVNRVFDDCDLLLTPVIAHRLPLAVQLVGPPADEATVLSAAAQLERARPWAGATPPLFSRPG